jgi:hypothetical protein
MEKWTEVPFLSFHIPQVPPMIKSKTHEAKNKVYKTHGAIMHLTLCNLGINTHKKKEKKKKKVMHRKLCNFGNSN